MTKAQEAHLSIRVLVPNLCFGHLLFFLRQSGGGGCGYGGSVGGVGVGGGAVGGGGGVGGGVGGGYRQRSCSTLKILSNLRAYKVRFLQLRDFCICEISFIILIYFSIYV